MHWERLSHHEPHHLVDSAASLVLLSLAAFSLGR